MADVIWPFGDLSPMTYDLVMIDVASNFATWSAKGQGKSPSAHYEVMTDRQIAALPVSHLFRGDGVLFQWATWPTLPKAIGWMESWGIRYVTAGVWVKRTEKGRLGFGGGYWVRSASEPWLIGSVGKPRYMTSRGHRNVIEGLVREHSRKPDEAYAWCESYMPAARRADVYSREVRPGWDSCGHERTKFNAEAT